MKENKNIQEIENSETTKVVGVDALVGLPPLQPNEIYNDDSFRLIERVPAKTVDVILEDMPYNTTACEWDVKIDLQLYWETRLRILKPTGVVILTASQPFTSELVMSNYKMFKYEWIWDKVAISNPMMANKQPLKCHENVLVFYNKFLTYNPILERGIQWHRGGRKEHSSDSFGNIKLINNGCDIDNNKLPKSIKTISNADKSEALHPTQKPVGLFEYLIRTYSNEGDLVFDGFGGSGTTAVAAHKSKRNFIVIEKEKKYFNLAVRRLDIERAQYTML